MSNETLVPTPRTASRRVFGTVYGVVTYVLFLGTFLYAFGFVTDLLVPRSINAPVSSTSWLPALLINVGLLGLFGLQHSGMARPGFKRWIIRWLPSSLERQTYVLATNVSFWVLFLAWRPMTGVVWSVDNVFGFSALFVIGICGWLLVLASTFMINHFDLFGLRQTFYHWKRRSYPELGFRVRGLYHVVRHPIQMGFVIAFWVTPHMTIGRMLFAGVSTAYILVALVLEERDLIKAFGDKYREYKAQVGKLVPTGYYRG